MTLSDLPEGQPDIGDWGGLVASTEDQIVQASVELYTNKVMSSGIIIMKCHSIIMQRLWEACQSRGFLLMETLFSRSRNASTFVSDVIRTSTQNILFSSQSNMLVDTVEQRASLRRNNLTGAMLW
jgi:hypothetical protein